jgi:hypothetical protein
VLVILELAVAAAFVGAFVIFAVFPALLLFLFFVIVLLEWLQIKQIRRMVDAGQYEQAKHKTLVWSIIGILIGGFIPGIVLLIAYLKFDPVINWQRQMQTGGQPPMQGGWNQPPAQSSWGGQPPAQPPAQQPPMAPMAQTAPPPAAAPVAPAAGTCPRCGKPATWVAQYNRWYCYGCQQYV